ncbi:CDP-glycerol glycerophosphotransferase family protein [Pedobacter sp.]|uniref:CDP-glycerol glycerophosphotransferase family protein n=1 Tax=Pedobacter sp. TaxID=1411316 RepID=UPI003D7FCDF8
MRYKTSLLKKIRQKVLSAVNKVLPKTDRVLVVGFPNVESSAIAVANYIAANYTLQVTYVVNPNLKDHPRGMLWPGIRLIHSTGSLKTQLSYFLELCSSKYLFFTHGVYLTDFSKSQVVTNIWHGVLYKKIGMLLGARAIPADITVGTSALTVPMFASAFGVPPGKVFISGYPRNDIMLHSKLLKDKLKHKINPALNTYKQLLIWMPTFRKNDHKEAWQDGVESGNPFYIPDFDVDQFNQVLAAHHAYCYVKSHPMAVKYPQDKTWSHLCFIDDGWISDHGVTLYHLLGCTDVLISDVSSVVIDYLLMDQPILCVSTDLEVYKQNRGFYFDDIEQWLPGPVLNSQEAFFQALDKVLKKSMQLNAVDGEGTELPEDAAAKKRQELKQAFFTYTDANSTARLVQQVFKLQK